MPWFDFAILAILIISAGLGFYQGAVREMISLVSFLVAVIAAVYSLKITGPIGRNLIDPDWAGVVVAAALSFVAVYAALRLLGAGLSRSVRKIPVLGLLDRTVGLGFGLLRAFIFLGACNLAFAAATPASLQPKWLAQSTFFPLTQTAGLMLRDLGPKGLGLAGRLAPSISNAVRDGSAKPKRDSGGAPGYDARERGGIDDLVEKAR